VHTSQGALLDLFERIETFFKRLESSTEVPSTETMSDLVEKVMVEMFSILAIATTDIRQGPICKLSSRKMSPLTYISSSTICEEAIRRDGSRGCAEETG
jgi:hypothetical protein